MIRERLRRLYYNSPVQVQRLCHGLEARRGDWSPAFRRVFEESYRGLRQTDFLARDRLEALQLERLRQLLEHAFSTTRYYRELFDRVGLRPGDIHRLEDLRGIPLLTKEIVQERRDDLISNRFPEELREYASTGGSTGLPLGFFQEKEATAAREAAFVTRQWERAGYRLGAPLLKVRRNISDYYAKLNPLWYYDHGNNYLVFSGQRLEADNLKRLVQVAEAFRPQFLHTYPSSAVQIANYLADRGIRLRAPLRAVLLSSENIYEQQRQWIEKVLGARVFGLYGNTERTVLAAECEFSSAYHVAAEYGVTELLDAGGNRVEGEGELGEVVSTGFNNWVMPFIRYRVGDLAVLSSSSCRCGRGSVLWKRIEGRMQELAVSRRGSTVSVGPTLLCNIQARDYARIRQFQLEQTKPGCLTVRIVREASCSEGDASEIMRRLFEERFPGLFDLEFEFVEKIERTGVNKFRFFVQKLPLERI